MQIDLAGKIAVVTGATGQLGRVMARTLAACGADVAIHYRQNAEMAKVLLSEITAFGVRGMVIQADVSEKDAVFAMRDAIAAQLGDPYIIVNNAVGQYTWKPVLEQAPEDYEGQFRTSVLHNVLMAQAFVPGMIAKGDGRVIAISTECVMVNGHHQSAYVSGKRGMDGVLRVLAKEVGMHGITVNQVAPGWTVSDRDRAAGTEHQEGYQRSVPLQRRGTDQEIANVVAFLASPLASFVSGVYIPVCGGNVMPGI